MSDELSELQREWRNSVTTSIKTIEDRTIQILDDLNAMKLIYVRESQLTALALRLAHAEELMSKRVTALENDRSKIVGAAVILNIVGGIVVAIILKLWK